VKLGGSSLRMFDLDQLEQWERACAVAAK
jgi:hypothetical protein